MPKPPTIGSALRCVVALLLGLLPLRAEWKEGELRTVAYVAEGKAVIWWWQDWMGHPWRFGGPGKQQKLLKPVRLEKPPRASRFFREGDELWDCSALLRSGDVLMGVESWAVYNDRTRRVVVRGTRGDHGRMDQLQREVLDVPPILVSTSVRLLRVPCAELGLVRWDAELVRTRGAHELIGLATTGRLGQTTVVELAGEAASGTIEAEVHVGADREVIDLKLAASARFQADGKERELDVHTGLTLRSEHPHFMEVGSADDPSRTLLLEVTCVARFMDGTPRSQRREFEDPQHQPPRFARRDVLVSTRKELRNGLLLGTWVVPPSLLEVLRVGKEEEEEADPDPFGGELVHEAKRRELMPVMEAVDLDLGPASDYTLLDVREPLGEAGIEVPDGGWVCFAPNQNLLLAKLDAAGLDLVESLMSLLLIDPPTLLHGTVSLIEWDGTVVEPGQMPSGARRLARAGLTLRPGQPGTLLLGREGDDGLEDGLTLDLTINQDVDLLALDYTLKVRGAANVSFMTSSSMHERTPLVVPLGEVDGKSRALVVEAGTTTMGREPEGERLRW